MKGIVFELSCAVVQKLEDGLWNHDLKQFLRIERIWHCLLLDPFYSTSWEEVSIGRCALGCAGEWKLCEEQRRSFLQCWRTLPTLPIAYAENAGFLGINAWHSLLLRLNSAPSHFA